MQTTLRHNLGFFSLCVFFCAFWLVAIIYVLSQGTEVWAGADALARQRVSWLPGPFSDTSPGLLIFAVVHGSSLGIVFVCSGFGRRYPKPPPPGSPTRPRWTHDLPLILVMLAWIGIGWTALGAPPLHLDQAQQFVLTVLWFSTFMFMAQITCAWIIARYGPPPVVRQAARK
jgi:hypothetical protein